MNSLWNSKINVFLDPLLKQADKDIYLFVHQQFSSLSYNIYDSLDEKRAFQNSLLNIYIYPTSRLSADESITFSDEDIFIEYQDGNLFLFGEQESNVNPQLELTFRSLEEWDSICTYIHIYFQNRVSSASDDLLQKSFKQMNSIASAKTFKETHLSDEDKHFLMVFEEKAYLCSSLRKIKDLVNGNQFEELENYSILKSPDLYQKKLSSFLALTPEEENPFYLTANEAGPLFIYLFEILFSSIQRFNIYTSEQSSFNEWGGIFNKIPIPISIFTRDQQLLLHNSLFVKLNLSAKECFLLKDDEQFTLEDTVYQIKKNEMPELGIVQVNFLPMKKAEGKNAERSSEELGIVSSSIAHELNNPLAGVLAALNVLELDDVSEEMHNKLQEMKNGVLRCKKLVETFLGFSKMKQKSSHAGIELGGMQESVNQALDLVRFRLIENNIKISCEYHIDKEFKAGHNSYVTSMIFYLFLGELVTSFSHHKLVVDQKEDLKIQLNMIERAEEVIVEIPHKIQLSYEFSHSKLVEHLLESQNLKILHESNQVIFSSL